MDDAQKKIAKALKENRDCLKNATMLKNVLADTIPNDKIHENLILNAYNEGIFKCFFEKDATLSLIQFIPMLVNNYGISEENAVWSVVTWCYVFSRGETAEALLNLNVGKSNNASNTTPQNNSSNSVPDSGNIEIGVCKAGVDMPAGTLRIKIEMDPSLNSREIPSFYYGVGSSPKEANDDSVKAEKQFYVELKEGDYLSLRKIGNMFPKQVTYEKVGD